MKELNELESKLVECNRYGYCASELADVAEAFQALEQRAEAAEAKLAELEKQEPVGYHRGEARAVFRVWPYADGDICVPVYSRPVPAINLAELVPNPSDGKYWANEGYGTRFKVQTYHGDVLAILRKIEEQSQ